MLYIRIKQLVLALTVGIPVTIKLLLKNNRTTYYIPHVGLGDYCYALGYLESYKLYHNIQHVTVITFPGREEVCGFYSKAVDDVLVLPKYQYTGLVYMGSLPLLRLFHLRSRRIENVSYTLHMNKALIQMNPALDVEDCTKIILKIPKSAIPVPPEVPKSIEISSFITEFQLHKQNTILLNPFSSGVSVKQLDDIFFRDLAIALKEKRYRVVTILANGNQKPVEGTEGIVASLAEAWHLAEWCGWVVGTRSGFFDYIRYSQCNIAAIYNDDYKQKSFFSLRRGKDDLRIHEVFYQGNYSALVDEIVALILDQQEKTADAIGIGHGRQR